MGQQTQSGGVWRFQTELAMHRVASEEARAERLVVPRAGPRNPPQPRMTTRSTGRTHSLARTSSVLIAVGSFATS